MVSALDFGSSVPGGPVSDRPIETGNGNRE